MRHKPVINRKVGKLNHELKIIIGLVELVPEEQVGLVREPNINKRDSLAGTWSHLGELEFFQFEALHNVITKDIGSSKQPATTAVLLVGYRSSPEVQAVVEDMLVCDPCRAGLEGRAHIRLEEYRASQLDL